MDGVSRSCELQQRSGFEVLDIVLECITTNELHPSDVPSRAADTE